MKFTEWLRRYRDRLLERPAWLAWLETAPSSIQEAERYAREMFILRQLPCTAILAAIHAATKHFGTFVSCPNCAILLPAIGIIVLFWPFMIVRLGLVAFRAMPESISSITRRLRIYAVVCLLLAGLCFFLIVALLYLLTMAFAPVG